jgi:cell division protein FtsQ
MKIYNDVISQLNGGGARYSQDLSEVDLSDPEDVKVLASDPQGEVLVHLGSSNYLERYKIYVSHVREWRQQFDKLESVDLRYDRQIVVNPDLQGAVKQAPVSLVSAKAAMAAGMKPAALITHQLTAPKSATALSPGSKPATKVAARKTARKTHHRATAKATSKPGAAPAQSKSVAKPDSAASQSPSSTSSTPGKTTATAPSAAAAKPGNKPSPAIVKGEENP